MRTLDLVNVFSRLCTRQAYFDLDVLPAQVVGFHAHYRTGCGADNFPWHLRSSWESRLPRKPDVDGFDLTDGRSCTASERPRTCRSATTICFDGQSPKQSGHSSTGAELGEFSVALDRQTRASLDSIFRLGDVGLPAHYDRSSGSSLRYQELETS